MEYCKDCPMYKPISVTNGYCRDINIDRSMISADYAHNFICDNILGIDSGNTMPTLFD